MKKVSMLLLLSLVVLVVMAQKNKEQPVNDKNSSIKCVRDYLKIMQPQIWYSLITQENDKLSKSSKEIKQVLDSTVIMAQGWTKDWIKDASNFYTYDAQGKCVTIQYNEYDNLLLSPQEKMTMLYDNLGKPFMNLIYEYEDGEWVIQMKIEYVFSGDLLSELLLCEWDDDTDEWMIELKDEMTYENNNLILLVTYNWDGSNFHQTYKEETTYYENKYVKEFISHIWYSDISDWMYLSKSEFSYDNSWNNILEIQSDWASIEWRDIGKTENAFDGENLVLSVFSSNYSYDDWEYESKDEYTYDENGNIIEEIEYSWLSEDWGFESKETYSFDYNYTNNDMIVPYIWDYYFNNMLTEIHSYSYFSDDWVEEMKELMYYNEKNVNAIATINNANTVVYPNPNNGNFVLKIYSENQNVDISMIDFFGRIIFSKTISNSKSEIEVSFDMSAEGSGVYFIRISQGDKISYKRIIIQ